MVDLTSILTSREALDPKAEGLVLLRHKRR
jgi:hypothetical protein